MASSDHSALADSLRRLPLISVFVFCLALPATGHSAPGDTTVVSLSTASTPAPGRCEYGGAPQQCVSGDGRYVVFESDAALVPEDTNGVWDIYLRDRVSNVTRRISIAADGTSANGPSFSPAISADGRFVAFVSFASNLVPNDTNGLQDLFVRDVAAGTNERVNLTATGAQQTTDYSYNAWISGDGRYVVFESSAALAPGDDSDASRDVYLRDRMAHATIRVSVRSDGTAPDGDYSDGGTISDDGRFVAFHSSASNLVQDDVNGTVDMFVRDMQTGTIERVSVGSDPASAGGGASGAISGDGRYVAFYSHQPLVPSDTNGQVDVYVRDRSLKTTELVSTSTDGRLGGASSFAPSLSRDGRFVVFTSYAGTFVPGDTNKSRDIFVRDRWNGTTERVSIATSGLEANGRSEAPSISADGTVVAYTSEATNLGTTTPNVMYVHELGGPKVTAWRLEPNSLAFGAQTITTGRALTVNVVNSGTVPVFVASVAVTGPDLADFTRLNVCHGWLQPTARCGIKVKFLPSTAGEKSAALQVTVRDDMVQSAALTGQGVLAAFTATPTDLAFGSVAVGKMTLWKSVAITNTGPSVLPIKSIALTGTDRSQFRRWTDCPVNLPEGGSCTARVRFAPAVVGAHQAGLTITAGGGAGQTAITVTGTGR